jgi:hypothetical protein
MELLYLVTNAVLFEGQIHCVRQILARVSESLASILRSELRRCIIPFVLSYSAFLMESE